MKVDCLSCENTNCLIKKHSSNPKAKKILEAKHTILCKKGQSFIMEGAPVHGLFFMYNGASKISRSGQYGKEQIIRFASPGEIVGHRGFGVNENYHINAQTIVDSTLCSFSSEALKEFLLTVPEMAYDLLLFFSEQLNTVETKVRTVAQMSVREKVIDTLLYIQRKFGNDDVGIKLILSRKEIADFSGTTEEQAIRVISSLKKEKLIVAQGKRIQIPDVALLQKEIESHHFYLDA